MAKTGSTDVQRKLFVIRTMRNDYPGGMLANELPASYRRLLKQLEQSGDIVYRDEKWHLRELATAKTNAKKIDAVMHGTEVEKLNVADSLSQPVFAGSKWEHLKAYVKYIDQGVQENCLDTMFEVELDGIISDLQTISDKLDGTEADREGDDEVPSNATMLDDLGRAGQPGYVFRKGERVHVTPAPGTMAGLFVCKVGPAESDDSVHISDTAGIVEFDAAVSFHNDLCPVCNEPLPCPSDCDPRQPDSVEPTSKQCGETSSIHVLAQEALDIQNACNPLGLTKRFAEVTQELWDHHIKTHSMRDLQAHCIYRLWVLKIMDLAGLSFGHSDVRVTAAYHEAQALAAF